MHKPSHKHFATSFTATIFFVVAITGVLMYFHLLDKYTKELHEILGLGFVAAALLHITAHWKPMQSYFTRKIFLISTIVVIIISFGFILSSTNKGPNTKALIVNTVLQAPIEQSFDILGQDVDSAKAKLEQNGIKLTDEISISDIARNNKISPFKIIKIITK